MDRRVILWERERGSDPDAWTHELRERVGPPLALAPGVQRVALFLADEAARSLTPGEGAAPPRFEAVIELESQRAADAQRLIDALPELGRRHVYRVETRRLKRYPRDWPDGEATPGVFMVAPVYRSPRLDARSFDAHWGDRHAPLALKHHVGMWEYRQHVVLEVATEDSPAFDGIAMLGFPTPEAFQSGLFDSDAGREAILKDTAHFLSLAESEAAMLIEHVLMDSSA